MCGYIQVLSENYTESYFSDKTTRTASCRYQRHYQHQHNMSNITTSPRCTSEGNSIWRAWCIAHVQCI